MNLLNLIDADGVSLKRYGSTWRGRCPFHGGDSETSLLVDVEAGRYFCFGCDAHGDEIQWLREKRGMTFAEACGYLGRKPMNGPRPTPASVPWSPKALALPSETWRARARRFLDSATAALWGPAGAELIRWLQKEKGLTAATIKTAALGYSHADIFEPRATWGLPVAFKEDGRERRQWVPSGLVIPLVIDSQVARLRIRRQWAKNGQRYVVVSGSCMTPIILSPGRAAAVVVESELDALLLAQEVGDIATAIAMGNATGKPDKTTHEVLQAAEVILVALDADAAGMKAAWDFWPATYGEKARRWPTIGGKDVSDARLKGLDIRHWAVTGIFETEAAFERWCIQTIDGGLSDAEALRAMKGGKK